MPKKFSTILFWFDGNFSESIAALTTHLLRPDSSGVEKLMLREKIQSLQQDLAIGKLDPMNFCREAVAMCQVSADPAGLAERLLDRADLNHPFFDIYTRITPWHDPRVIVDIPRDWFEKLIRRWQVQDAFPLERLIFTESFKLARMLPEIAERIPRAAGRRLDECILVDPLQMRAVALHKLGLVSTAYVYPRRLKIDLALQGIWETDEDVYHPTAGSRTNI